MGDYYFDDSYYDTFLNEDILMDVIGVVLGVLGIVLLVAIAFYVLESLSVYTIAKRRGIKNPGLAWVPIANYWVLGCISDQYKYVAKGQIQNRRKVMLTLAITSAVLSIISTSVEYYVPGLAVVLSLANYGVSIAAMVFWYMALYDLFNSCNPKNSVLFLVLSILLGVIRPFFLLACRNKDLGMPPRKPAQPAPEAVAAPHWQTTPEEPAWESAPEPDWQPTEPEREPWENNNEE